MRKAYSEALPWHELTFGLSTNGTLVDEAFTDEMGELGNLNVYLSIEGFREKKLRRGIGTYDKVIAVDISARHRIRISICYHSENYLTVTGDEFWISFAKRAWFGWCYLPSYRQRCNLRFAAQKTCLCQGKDRGLQKRKNSIIDFPNSGRKSIGCVAASNDFAHINANGDLEPCAFCHYSDVNINDMSLTEALRSPFFKRFRNSKPFSSTLRLVLFLMPRYGERLPTRGSKINPS